MQTLLSEALQRHSQSHCPAPELLALLYLAAWQFLHPNKLILLLPICTMTSPDVVSLPLQLFLSFHLLFPPVSALSPDSSFPSARIMIPSLHGKQNHMGDKKRPFISKSIKMWRPRTKAPVQPAFLAYIAVISFHQNRDVLLRQTC